MPRVVLAIVAVMGLVAAGCSGGDDLDGAAARMSAGGTLDIAVDDGWSPATVGDTIPDGGRVRTGTAEARLELRHGEVWLAPHSMAVVTMDVVDVIRGDLLVASGGTLAARWAEVEIDGQGVFRLTPGVAPVARVYGGEGEVRRPGERRSVPALRQVNLAASRLPAPVPLDYETADPWDRALLPLAVTFDEEISRIGRGIDRQHGVEPQDAAFYATFAAVDETVIPILASASRLLTEKGFGPPSDALLTLFMAEVVAAVEETDLATAAQRVSRQRSAGARWGLLALEYEITTSELSRAVGLGEQRRLASVEEGIVEPPLRTADAPAPVAADTAGGDPRGGGGPTSAAPPARSGPTAPAAGTPATDEAPPPDGPSGEVVLPVPGPLPGPVPEPVEPGPEPGPEPEPSPSLPLGHATGVVGAVLGDVIDAAEGVLP
jgi:hypothetical protein